MDIIDVILAKALTPQQLNNYIKQAQQATSIATEAATNLDALTEQTNTNNTNAENALAQAQEAYELNSDALARIDSALVGSLNDEIDKLTISKITRATNEVISTDLRTTYPDETTKVLQDVVKYYTSHGQNTDGTMTQKAITDIFTELNGVLDSFAESIEELQASGASTNMGVENAGKILIVNSEGYLTPSTITEEALLSALIKSGDYIMDETVGLKIDYANRTFTPWSGDIPSSLDMFGGRAKCNVDDNGRITAWIYDAEYKEDGSNGQVMVYQPKFYYMRIFDNVEDFGSTGQAIRKETLLLSDTPVPGFKLHPLFIRPDGTELDYVLLSAYEGSAQDENANYITDDSWVDINTAKLSSVASVQPISGVNKQLTVLAAEQMAQNRGENWHITNLAYESAMQMLQMIEYGSLNGQAALEDGICNIPNRTTINCASLTGSTSRLGNTSGAAEETVNTSNGVITYTDPGKRAISYRGVENPWGNIWRMVGGASVSGNGSQAGGILYACTDFDYSDTIDASNYKSVGIILPSSYDWISAFGRPADDFDWVYIPIECTGANSAVPVGDNMWTTSKLNGTNLVAIGGPWHFGQSDGMFYYSFDQGINTYGRSFSARLMYIPEKDENYEANINSWLDYINRGE